MENQSNLSKAQLEKEILKLNKNVKKLAGIEILPKIIIDIHKPGWTTPAEFLLFKNLVNNTNVLVSQIHENINIMEHANKFILR
jgi:hypothetical protein